MKKYNEKHPEGGDTMVEIPEETKDTKGRVFDLILPIATLILFCVLAMLYTGGILEGASVKDAFADCSAGLSLALGSFFTLIVIFLLYIPRKVISARVFMESLTDGFKAMVPAILILTFAWTLSGICGESYLNAGAFVSNLVSASSMPTGLLPAIFFLVALGLAFATGTSWGTFAILIPIAVSVFGGMDITPILTISVASILAGAVCGDHISPISDTTILASTGANCNHLDHVSTQSPYALLVAAVCFVSYLLAGFTESIWISLPVGFALLILILLGIYFISKKKTKVK